MSRYGLLSAHQFAKWTSSKRVWEALTLLCGGLPKDRKTLDRILEKEANDTAFAPQSLLERKCGLFSVISRQSRGGPLQRLDTRLDKRRSRTGLIFL